MVKLTKEAVQKIETALDGGYDVEVRKNKIGITVASVGKKLIFKSEIPIIETEKTEK